MRTDSASRRLCARRSALGGAAAAQSPAAANAPAAPAAAPNTLGPQELVENSAKRMLAELDANRPMYAKDPAKLDALVANVLLPNFDSEYAARLVLGQTWRTATPEQRKRFVDAFYHSLLRNYGNGAAEFHGRSLRHPALQGRPERHHGHRAHRGEEVLGRESAGEFQSAQNRSGLEGLGRRHRGHLLRQELPHRFRVGNSAEGAR